MIKLNQRELDVLNILWNSNEPLIASAIVTESKAQLTQSTVTTVLRKLLEQDLVEVDSITHSGKVLSRAYRPTKRSKQYIVDHFTQSYQAFQNVISNAEMASAIMKISSPEHFEDEIAKLTKILEDYEKGQ